MLPVDAGDALYARPELGVTPGDVGRARLLLQAMGSLGYAGMAVGERDLGHGLAELKQMAADTGVPLLSANLLDAQGNHPFPATRVVETSAGKVGLFGLTQLFGIKTDLKAEDPVEAARAAVKALRAQGVVAVVGLLHMTSVQAQELLHNVSGVDVAVVAHEGQNRLVLSSPASYTAGNKGREVYKIHFALGSGPVHDAGERTSNLNEVKILDNNIRMMEERAKTATTPEARKQFEGTLASLRARRQAAQAIANSQVEGRPAREQIVSLDTRIPDDAGWARKVEAEVARDGRTPGH